MRVANVLRNILFVSVAAFTLLISGLSANAQDSLGRYGTYPWYTAPTCPYVHGPGTYPWYGRGYYDCHGHKIPAMTTQEASVFISAQMTKAHHHHHHTNTADTPDGLGRVGTYPWYTLPTCPYVHGPGTYPFYGRGYYDCSGHHFPAMMAEEMSNETTAQVESTTTAANDIGQTGNYPWYTLPTCEYVHGPGTYPFYALGYWDCNGKHVPAW